MSNKIIKESVNKVLFSKKYSNRFRRRSLRESFEDEEDALWRQFGYDPNIISQLNNVDSFETLQDDGIYTCGLSIDEDGPSAYINDYDVWGEEAIEWIDYLVDYVKRNGDPSAAWESLSFDSSL